MKLSWKGKSLLDHLWGPTGSVLFHVLVFAVIVKFAVSTTEHVAPPVEVFMKDIEAPQDLDKVFKEVDKLQDIPTVVDAVAPPEVSIDQEPPQVDALGSEGSGGAAGDAAGGDGQDLSQFTIMEAVSPLKFRGLYASRSASGRKEALGKFSGGLGEQTEYSVKKSLVWLKKHQYPDGSWGPQYRVAMTGLALLTFMAHGETTSSEEYGDAIRRGLRFLLKSQKNGVFVGGGPVYDSRMDVSQISVYEHAIGTYAVCEAYGLTGIPFLKIAMEDAVQVIIDGQHEGGSWDYGYRHGGDANMDVSVAGWHLQALKAAAGSGAENQGLKTSIENGIRGLKAMTDKAGSGMFRYSTRLEAPPNLTMTGVAVLCMELAGHAMDAESRAGIRVLQDMSCRWTKGGEANQDLRGTGEWPLYAWYYITQARFHQGGKTWMIWNRQFAPMLCSVQNPDGSWCAAPQSIEARFGPVYCTTLAALMLEVYYRFLPTYQPIEVDTGKPSKDQPKEDEEITIKFG